MQTSRLVSSVTTYRIYLLTISYSHSHPPTVHRWWTSMLHSATNKREHRDTLTSACSDSPRPIYDLFESTVPTDSW